MTKAEQLRERLNQVASIVRAACESYHRTETGPFSFPGENYYADRILVLRSEGSEPVAWQARLTHGSKPLPWYTGPSERDVLEWADKVAIRAQYETRPLYAHPPVQSSDEGEPPEVVARGLDLINNGPWRVSVEPSEIEADTWNVCLESVAHDVVLEAACTRLVADWVAAALRHALGAVVAQSEPNEDESLVLALAEGLYAQDVRVHAGKDLVPAPRWENAPEASRQFAIGVARSRLRTGADHD